MLLLYSIGKYTQYFTITYNGKISKTNIYKGFPHGSVVKNPPAKQETRVGLLGQEDSPGEGNGNPLQYSCLGNPMDRRARWAIVPRVTKESGMT